MDLLLRNADVYDGSGAPARRLDVAVSGGRISAIETQLPEAAAEVVDLDGLALAPGFIDIHTHSDISLLHDPYGESKARQGVTTEVVGNCGYSAFPVHPARRSELSDHLARLGDEPMPIGWTGFPSYTETMRNAKPALNVAMLTGHSALRIAAMADPYRPATDDDVGAMARLLEEALEQGAFGLSTGLTHTPSAFGDAAEITVLVRVCARHDAVYATHARVAAGREIDAIDEAIATTRAASGRLQFSHLALNDPAWWGRAAQALARFDAAGIDAAFDVYPYDASSSAMLQYLPEWTQEGGGSVLRRNHRDPAWRARALADIRRGFFGGIPWYWERIVVVAAGPRTDLPGQSVATIAAAWDCAPEEVLLDLCAELGSIVQVILYYRTEADMTQFLAHPLAVVGSDGNAQPLRPRDALGDRPHPRAFGTFPRVLGRYVREQPVLGLPEAIRKMTAAPADRLGLRSRGRLRPGYAADLVVFDPVTVADRATFDEPRQAPVGIRHTMVNGRFVVRDGVLTGERSGEVLRHV